MSAGGTALAQGSGEVQGIRQKVFRQRLGNIHAVVILPAMTKVTENDQRNMTLAR
jgi:hypothetical protein